MAGRKPPNAGKGRPKGVPNKTTKTVRDSILAAFDKLGGVKWLVALGKSDPKEFARLLGRLLPREVTVTGTSNAPPPASLNDPAVLAAALALDEVVDAVRNPTGPGPADEPTLPVGTVSPPDPAAPAPAPDGPVEAAERAPVSPVAHDVPAAAREIPHHI